ncbi:MAG TPA: DNA internalization-related competence protein ComEC/Rec2, partial [Steroidobacteraceae bacterium]|nr:DNA internalization-related competence protein ComEC/Rec2 [Steroidobacteraceae bacterium]
PPANVLSLALIAVLLYDPHAVLTAGLWLSFVAVAAIIMGAGSFLERPKPLRAFLSTQAAVSVALVPATALLFGSVSLVAPVANLFAIPLFSALLVPGTLLGIAFIVPFPWLGEQLFGLAARLYEVSWPAFEWAASLPGALIHLPAPQLPQALLMGASAVVLMSPSPGWMRAPGLLLLVSLICSQPARPVPGAFSLTTLDVGEGLSVVVRTHSHALLFDAGPAFRSGRSAGELVIVPYLQAQGISRLDMLVTSHADNDHAGGAAAVEEAFAVTTARQGGTPRMALRTPSSACNKGEAWIWEGVRFEFLHPLAGEQWSDNNGSCVLAITAGATRVLLTGDIEHDAEKQLLARTELAYTGIVIVPHHGSRSSSSERFVSRLHARWAVVSAGAGNRWGFPHETVVRRWCEAGAEVIGTAEWGAILITVDATTGATPPRSYRQEHRRYWHARSPGAGRSRCLCAPDGAVSSAAVCDDISLTHVGNHPSGRAVHVAHHPLLDLLGGDRAGAVVDVAAQARVADRAHRTGLEVAEREPGQ